MATNKRLRVDEIKVGDRLACVQYYEVLKTVENNNNYFTLKNEEGETSNVSPSILEKECFSAGQYTETCEVSQTEIIHRLMGAGDTVFTAVFHKLLPKKEIERTLAEAVQADLTNKKRRVLLAKKLSEGEERTLRGYLIRSEPDFARSLVVDLDVKADPSQIIARDKVISPYEEKANNKLKQKLDSKPTAKKRKYEDSKAPITSVTPVSTNDDNLQEKKEEKEKEEEETQKKQKWDTRWRLIDHRTLKTLILKNIRYVVKR